MRAFKVGHDNQEKILGKIFNSHNLTLVTQKESHGIICVSRALTVDGLPYIRFNNLRHSHAAMSLKANFHPKMVSA